MKTSQLLLSLFIALSWAATAQAKSLVNKNGANLAVKGYDVVAFHVVGDAVKGNKEITHAHAGAIYRFSSDQHKDLFVANPEKYVPAYGGYCAWGLAAKGELYPVSVKTWQIIDGRLFLNYDKGVQEKFNKDANGFIGEADLKWSALVAKAEH